MKGIVLFSILLGLAVHAEAKTSLNSVCYMLDEGARSKIQGEHTNELFEIASVSKVVTSYWALHQLGPQFRFGTRIFITPVGRDVFDVHIQGARDPFWGRQLTHFLFSQLNRNGVREIRRLSFDENLGFRWLVISDNVESEVLTPQEIADSIARHIRALASEYPRTRQEAANLGMSLPKTLSLKAQSVEFIPANTFQPSSGTKSFVVKSAPLYRYLKEMNTVSNNHVADKLFEILGGVQNFRNFVQSNLNLNDRDLVFVNGSGNSIGGANGGVKDYNRATCEAILRVQYQMQSELHTKHGMSLKDVMSVSGADGGTLSPRFDSIRNSMVAKTGTVDPAVTLAGVLSTNQGEVYFGVFMNTDSPADWNNARDQVRNKVMDLIQQYGGRRTFDYATRSFLPFDSSSGVAFEEPPILTALP
ncbi:MAG: D-alanyl-D-alanine carboxypeptidase [Bdellovibrionales bacterium]|nr:D-alanyl-D-alanine carboxypeptidase [Bdellovibrionales bacterium]